MSRFISCSCGAQLKVPDNSAGRKARCPACGTVQTIPAETETTPRRPVGDPGPGAEVGASSELPEGGRAALRADPPLPPAPEMPVVLAGEEVAGERRRRSWYRRKWVWAWVAVPVLLFMLVVAGEMALGLRLIWQAWTGPLPQTFGPPDDTGLHPMPQAPAQPQPVPALVEVTPEWLKEKPPEWFPGPGPELERLRQVRRNWHKQTYSIAYEKYGHKDPRWDAAARRALAGAEALGQKRGRGGDEKGAIWKAAREAVAAGCDDPLIRYLRVRWSPPLEEMAPEERRRLYLEAAEALRKSDYPAARRAHALYNASTEWMKDKKLTPADRKQVESLLEGCCALLPEILKDHDPVAWEEALDLAKCLLNAHKWLDGDREPGFRKILAVLEKARAPKAFRLLFTGEFYVLYAWDARGTAFAGEVPKEAWSLFGERLQKAYEALKRSWELDPFSPLAATRMITVCMGGGLDWDEMERWFRRAIQVDPECYDACRAKLVYMEPKWGGDAQEEIAFARECARTRDWEARLPFLLVEAHGALASSTTNSADYYREPVVWGNIRAVYTASLEKFPQSHFDRAWYARWAYICGRYQEAHRQFQQLGDEDWWLAFATKEQYREARNYCTKAAENPPRSGPAGGR